MAWTHERKSLFSLFTQTIGYILPYLNSITQQSHTEYKIIRNQDIL